MSILNNIAAESLVYFGTRKIISKNRAEKSEAIAGCKPAENINVGEYLLDSAGNFNLITNISVTEEVTLKRVVLSNGLVIKVDNSSTISEGDTVTTYTGNSLNVDSISTVGTSKCYSFTTKEGSDFIVNEIVVSL